MTLLDRVLFSFCLTFGCVAYSSTYYLWWPLTVGADRLNHELPYKLFLWVFVACFLTYSASRQIRISGGPIFRVLEGMVKGLLATGIIYFFLALVAVLGAFAPDIFKNLNFESVATLGLGLMFILIGVFTHLLPALPYGAAAGAIYAGISGGTKRP